MKTVGQILKAAREAKGLSMRAIARVTGKQHSYLSLIENDGISPSVDSLREICPAYGVAVWEAASGLTKEELVQQTLGDIPLTDPAVSEMLRLAALPDGPQVIQRMLDVAKADPQQLRDALEILDVMRKRNIANS